ncbi:MAG: helix-turn-helix domain-containing protein [Chloroflexaceae bacterium]|nr:helix-turn-helix domain-containing protein [Chloroflexaceae bacterium]
MKPQTFGRLIQVLRREHYDEEGQPWNQQQLAQAVNRILGQPDRWNEDVVSKIERGKRGIKPDEMAALATVLHLTSSERQQFFWLLLGLISMHWCPSTIRRSGCWMTC